MAEMLQFDLVSPEKKVASAEALSVVIPGNEGDITALPNHATFLTTLRPGILSVTLENAVEEYLVTGGFVEISKSGATVLAEMSVKKSEATAEMIEQLVVELEKDLENAPEDSGSILELRLNDLRILAGSFT